MYVVVNHAISDASKFWAIAQSATAALPAGYAVRNGGSPRRL